MYLLYNLNALIEITFVLMLDMTKFDGTHCEQIIAAGRCKHDDFFFSFRKEILNKCRLRSREYLYV